ncbi:hypothetical protein [Streptomyces termitum]|uniref:hypothetical protein n=1 Tax=Streptomyces termitum TaxID=67368 RepID=UPI0033BCC5CA
MNASEKSRRAPARRPGLYLVPDPATPSRDGRTPGPGAGGSPSVPVPGAPSVPPEPPGPYAGAAGEALRTSARLCGAAALGAVAAASWALGRRSGRRRPGP